MKQTLRRVAHTSQFLVPVEHKATWKHNIQVDIQDVRLANSVTWIENEK